MYSTADKQTTTEGTIGRSSDVNHFPSVVKEINAKLLIEVYGCRSDLLHPKQFRIGIPFDCIPSPKHPKGRDDIVRVKSRPSPHDLVDVPDSHW